MRVPERLVGLFKILNPFAVNKRQSCGLRNIGYEALWEHLFESKDDITKQSIRHAIVRRGYESFGLTLQNVDVYFVGDTHYTIIINGFEFKYDDNNILNYKNG